MFIFMLQQLHIRNFAIIDDITLHFPPGLTVLTGETGAGKSIVIDALGLALGERAHSGLVKSGKSETQVEAFFEVTGNPALEELGIGTEEGLILRRTLLASGKSRAYINDTLVNVQSLVECGRSLVDMHGQHEHQSLLFPEHQRGILDAYGKLLGRRQEIAKLFAEVLELRRRLTALTGDVKEREHRIDLLGFQVREIESASLREGEKEELLQERHILSNLTRLRESTGKAYDHLYSGEGATLEKLSAAASLLKDAARIDQDVEEVLRFIESAQPVLEEAAASLRRLQDRYAADPQKLEEIEERLDLISRLERKYGEGIPGILAYHEQAEKELRGLVMSDKSLGELQETLAAGERRLTDLAVLLSADRKGVALRIEQSMKPVLGSLALEKAEFRIRIAPAPLSSAGCDLIEFMFTANRGEPPKPLSKTASGGELSRVMLALKGILAEVDKVPVLIFDEIDAGIGGTTAGRVGRQLKTLSGRHQVICVTHLPQIAAVADHHFVIEKVQKKEGVCVRVKQLSHDHRVEEIARMLSGTITDISLRHARELLEQGPEAGK